MMESREFAPAKINLFLAVTGRRADGFHELVSLVAPLALGDTLDLAPAPGDAADSLRCDMPGVPLDGTNLVLKAAAAFRRRTGAGAPPPVRFSLRKETPHGAGLGGGSSDAAAALRGLNRLAPTPLPPAELAACAAEIGSDVPLFLHGGPVVMRGRGEQVAPLPAEAAAALCGREALIFKPAFGVPTAWAYRRLAQLAPGSYVSAAAAEARLAAWLAAPAGAPVPMENNLERPVFEKYLALPELLDELRARFGLEARMSGSGSACFALPARDAPRGEIEGVIRAAWGGQALVRFTHLL